MSTTLQDLRFAFRIPEAPDKVVAVVLTAAFGAAYLPARRDWSP